MRRRVKRLLPHGGLWQHGDFLKLWAGQTISEVGSAVSQLALPLVAVIVLDATTFEVALLGTLQFLPFLLFALPAGVWVDRVSRRSVLILGDVGRALLLLSIPIAYAFDVLSLPQLFAVAFCIGILTVFFDVAYQAYLPYLVDREEVVEGNSKLQTTVSGAAIIGPGLGGALVSALTAPYAILVDAFSFVASGAFTVAIRRREPPRDAEHAQLRMRTELLEGLRFVFRQPYLRAQALSTSISNYFSSLAFAILVVFMVRVLHMSPALIGVALMGGGLGWLLGSLTSMPIGKRIGVGPTTILGAAITGPGMILSALAPRSAPLPFILTSGAVASFGAVVYNIQQVSLRQLITPQRLQGRMTAVMRFLVWGTIPLGSLTGGALGSVIGLRATLVVGAIGTCTSVIPIVLSPTRRLMDFPEAEPDVAPFEPDVAPTSPLRVAPDA
jgi:MFS family permease